MSMCDYRYGAIAFTALVVVSWLITVDCDVPSIAPHVPMMVIKAGSVVCWFRATRKSCSLDEVQDASADTEKKPVVLAATGSPSVSKMGEPLFIPAAISWTVAPEKKVEGVP